MKTKAVFRIYPKSSGGEILALFPQIPESYNGYSCSCYAHVGQHSGADPMVVVGQTRPAKPAEYADLKRELEGLGYDLQVASKCTSRDFKIRREACKTPI